MTLHCSEIPESFTGQAMYALARSSWFNVTDYPNVDPSRKRSSFEMFARLTIPYPFCSWGVGMCCAPVGALYHTGMALKHAVVALRDVRERNHACDLGLEHLKAAMIDGSFAVSMVALSALALSCGTAGRLALYALTFFSGMGLVGVRRVMGMWFSSSLVRSGWDGAQALEISPDDQLNACSPAWFWGATEPASVQSCAYRRLKEYNLRIYQQEGRNLPLNDLDVMKSVLIGAYEEAKETTSRARGPAFLSKEVMLEKGNTAPKYPMPWKTIAWVAACVAAVVLLVIWLPLISKLTGIASAVPRGDQLLLNLYMEMLRAAGLCHSLAGAFVAGSQAVNTYVRWRGSAEIAYGASLMIAPATGGHPNYDIQRTREGLFWLHRAACRGYVPAQFNFGISLLASLSYHNSPETMSLQELRIAREAICWLQAAAINGSSMDPRPHGSAGWLVNRLLSLNWERIQKGVVGATEEEQHRAFLGGVEPAAMQTVREAYAVLYPAPDVSSRITEALTRPRRAANARVVQAVTELPDVLANLVGEYTV